MTPETKRQMRKLLKDRLVELRAELATHLQVTRCDTDECSTCSGHYAKVQEINYLLTAVELKPTTQTRVGVTHG